MKATQPGFNSCKSVPCLQPTVLAKLSAPLVTVCVESSVTARTLLLVTHKTADCVDVSDVQLGETADLCVLSDVQTKTADVCVLSPML